MTQPPNPSTVVWDWRRTTAADPAGAAAAAQDREAAAARRRGLIGAAVGFAVAGLFYYLGLEVMAAVVAAVTLVLTILALAAPLTAYRRVTGWIDRFARGVGVVVTWALMTILYYVVFLPLGLFLRARGKLAITQGTDPSRPTYWRSTADRVKTLDSYRKQF
jgi:hypothetical protein